MGFTSTARRIVIATAMAASGAGLTSDSAQAQSFAQGISAASHEGGADMPHATGGSDARAAGVVTHPVAARELERGEVLTAEDIRYVPLPEGEAVPEDAPDAVLGWTTRRLIHEGEALREPAISPPDLVRAGEPVEVLYQGRSVVLRVKGTATSSAAMGERVLVRVDARRRLEGVVIGPALVQLESNESR